MGRKDRRVEINMTKLMHAYRYAFETYLALTELCDENQDAEREDLLLRALSGATRAESTLKLLIEIEKMAKGKGNGNISTF